MRNLAVFPAESHRFFRLSDPQMLMHSLFGDDCAAANEFVFDDYEFHEHLLVRLARNYVTLAIIRHCFALLPRISFEISKSLRKLELCMRANC
jgi:DNA-binding FadR family transcriptional regulator